MKENLCRLEKSFPVFCVATWNRRCQLDDYTHVAALLFCPPSAVNGTIVCERDCAGTHFHVLWIVPNSVTHSDLEHQQQHQWYSHPLSLLPCALLEVSLWFMSHYASCEAERTPSSPCALLCKLAIPPSDWHKLCNRLMPASVCGWDSRTGHIWPYVLA